MAVQIGDSNAHLSRDGLALVNGSWYIVIREGYPDVKYWDYNYSYEYLYGSYGGKFAPNAMRVYKATVDPTTVWHEQDGGNVRNDYGGFYLRGAEASRTSVFATGSQLHIASDAGLLGFYSPFGFGGTSYSVYDCTTDRWSIFENTNVGYFGFGYGGGSGGGIVVRSNGDVLMVQEWNGPTIYKRTAPSTWAQVVDFGDYGYDWGFYFEGPSARIALGASDRVHVFFDSYNYDYPYFYDYGYYESVDGVPFGPLPGLLTRSASSTNALDPTQQTIDNVALNVPVQTYWWFDDSYYQGAAKKAHSWTDASGNVRIGVVYQDVRFGVPPPVGLSYAHAISGADPTWSHSVMSNQGAALTEPAVVADTFIPGRLDALHSLWIRDADSAIMHSTSTDKGVTWTTDSAPIVVGQAAVGVNAIIYTRLGYVYIGYAYENLYGVFFGEYQVRRLSTGGAMIM